MNDDIADVWGYSFIRHISSWCGDWYSIVIITLSLTVLGTSASIAALDGVKLMFAKYFPRTLVSPSSCSQEERSHTSHSVTHIDRLQRSWKPIHKEKQVRVHSSFLAIRWCTGYAYLLIQHYNRLVCGRVNFCEYQRLDKPGVPNFRVEAFPQSSVSYNKWNVQWIHLAKAETSGYVLWPW